MMMMMTRRRRRKKRRKKRVTTISQATFPYKARLQYLLEYREFLDVIFAPYHSVMLLAD
jgi:hypothetical protein